MNQYANETILIQFRGSDLGLVCNEIKSEQWDSCCAKMMSTNMFFHAQKEIKKRKLQTLLYLSIWLHVGASGSACRIQLPTYISSCIRTSQSCVQSEN